MPDLRSPGALLAEQVRVETILASRLEKLTERFFASVQQAALRDGEYLSPADVSAEWESLVRSTFDPETSPLTDDVEANTLARDALIASSVAVLAYLAAREVMRVAAVEGWSTRTTRLRLSVAFDRSPMSSAEAVVMAAERADRAVVAEIPTPDQPDAAPLTLPGTPSTVVLSPEEREAVARVIPVAFGAFLAVGAVLTLDLMATGAESWATRLTAIIRQTATITSSSATLAALQRSGYSQKRWVTRRDNRVRPTHAAVDGQTISIHQPFIVGGVAMSHPGERGVSLAQTAGCRCFLVGVR